MELIFHLVIDMKLDTCIIFVYYAFSTNINVLSNLKVLDILLLLLISISFIALIEIKHDYQKGKGVNYL